ncbi:cell division protein CpoB [Dickeya dadantii]|uniref:cell division protein CpoB n=1 Tax=Dickeya dadantii TaxID=204038 RepID=UPI0021D928CB|nr:cell division protein CpoB [Dickeya dadantii]
MSSNFRHHLLSLSLLVGVAVPWAATAQAPISNVGSGSVEDRVTQLERISNAHSQLLTQLQQQLADTQRDIDGLRGQIQENQYQLNQVVERQKQIYQQIDSLGSQSGGQSSAAASSAAGAGNAAASAPAASSDTGAANSASADSAAAPAMTGDANTDYNTAASLVLEKKQYDQAIVAFQNFVKKYPDSTYQPNANYWLGQLFYNKGKKDDAAYYFANVVKNYPKSPKASEAMFKVGVIMQEKGQTDKAKAVYQQVVKTYPNTDGAKQAQKRLAGL